MEPQGAEDPQVEDTTLPAYKTNDARFDVRPTFQCDTCTRQLPTWKPGAWPITAFVFRCSETRGFPVEHGLPPHGARQAAFREKAWNAQMQCTWCLSESWSRSVAEVDDILAEAAAVLLPPGVGLAPDGGELDAAHAAWLGAAETAPPPGDPLVRGALSDLLDRDEYARDHWDTLHAPGPASDLALRHPETASYPLVRAFLRAYGHPAGRPSL